MFDSLFFTTVHFSVDTLTSCCTSVSVPTNSERSFSERQWIPVWMTGCLMTVNSGQREVRIKGPCGFSISCRPNTWGPKCFPKADHVSCLVNVPPPAFKSSVIHEQLSRVKEHHLHVRHPEMEHITELSLAAVAPCLAVRCLVDSPTAFVCSN